MSIPDATGLQIEFSAFSSELCCDRLYYGVGQTNHKALAAAYLKGSNIPEPIDLTGGSAWFRFISDGSVEYNGFSLTYRAVFRKFIQDFQLLKIYL